jgi:hypothetical protein
VLRVDYAPPYIRHVPTRLSRIRPSGPSGVESSHSFPSRADPFVAEWRAFHASVTNGISPALLQNSAWRRASPDPRRLYATRTVLGVPRAVKRFRRAARI